jgi:hypothetical protein
VIGSPSGEVPLAVNVTGLPVVGLALVAGATVGGVAGTTPAEYLLPSVPTYLIVAL